MRNFSSSSSSYSTIICRFMIVVLLAGNCCAWLRADFYKSTCPELCDIVYTGVKAAVAKEKRMAASLLRLHFHDCFVQGCDASILLDDSPGFRGEQTITANNNSIRGMDVIDDIKANVEAACPGIVSCADILTIAARDSVVLLGGPSWSVKVGRRDSKSASFELANSGVIPLASSDLANLINRFEDVGLSPKDMVVLSGSHTIGQARCVTFRGRIYNGSNIDPAFQEARQANCPAAAPAGNNNLAPLDLKTPNFFDNSYFVNLLNNKGLLQSDQILFSGVSTDSLVQTYSRNPKAFFADFAAAMVRMGDITPLTGSAGEIRNFCAGGLIDISITVVLWCRVVCSCFNNKNNNIYITILYHIRDVIMFATIAH